jgi:outer membrane protein TolC
VKNRAAQADLGSALTTRHRDLYSAQQVREQGAEPIFFVLDAQTKLAQAESDLLQTEVQYQAALASVDHATGGLPELGR